MTFRESLEQDREQVERALKGEMIAEVGDDGGVKYKAGTKEECDNAVMSVVDYLIFQLSDYNDCMNAFEEAVFKILPTRKYKKLYGNFIKQRFKLPFE